MAQQPRPDPGNESPLQFRVATDADRPRIISLVNAAYSIETFLQGTRTDEERLIEMMQKGVILLAEDNSGELLGCVYTEVRGPRGYLGQLAVDPTHQGKGLARIIVQAAEDRLRAEGCEVVDITVLNLRPELPPIYRRFGYVETGIVEEFRPTRQLAPGVEIHGIRMSKQL
jgi:ribosomal protein S18 acetylase RimI-like enzyme